MASDPAKDFHWYLKSASSFSWYMSVRGKMKHEIRPVFDSHEDFLTLRGMGRNFRFVVEAIEHQFRSRAFDIVHISKLVVSELQSA